MRVVGPAVFGVIMARASNTNRADVWIVQHMLNI